MDINAESTAVTAPQTALQQTEEVSVMQLITRMASDPALNTDKLKTLIELQERMVAKKAEADFNDALKECQKECGRVSADATNPQTRSKYATYAKLDGVLRPIYTRHGFSVSFSTADTPKPEHVRVIAYVGRGGHTRVYPIDMPSDGKGAKGNDVMSKTHATGAAMQYGSRYLLKGIFNVAVGEDDKDGNDPNAARAMADGVKADFENAIDALTDMDAWQALWGKILAANADVVTHEELRAKLAAKKRELTTVKK